MVTTSYITFQSLNRMPWLPQLLWEGWPTPFLFHDMILVFLRFLVNDYFHQLASFVCEVPDLLQMPRNFRGVAKWQEFYRASGGILPSHAAIFLKSWALHCLTIFLFFSELLRHLANIMEADSSP